MARKVCEFIIRALENNGESNDIFVVNCHMGVSRSCAVFDFVRSVCGIDYGFRKRMNPRNNLNLLDGDLLRAAWEELEKKRN
jgi:hypothetical protein